MIKTTNKRERQYRNIALTDKQTLKEDDDDDDDISLYVTY